MYALVVQALVLVQPVPRIAIAGAHGGLGRELTQQSLDKNWQTIGLVRRKDPIIKPFRNGWLEDTGKDESEINSNMLNIVLYDSLFTERTLEYDYLVFCLSGTPFQKDYTDLIVDFMCRSLPASCKKVCLVSALGVGDSIKGANVGIQIMSDWYLKDVYRAKNKQEKIVSSILDRETIILRPNALSYGKVPYNNACTPRQKLAEDILDWFEGSVDLLPY
tara:strand:+ start:833 stop:1489 length:657 start_codon:yes stop_codon:yes gene_type:complete